MIASIAVGGGRRCPLQHVQMGSLTLAAFPGETVVDYSLRTKRELGGAFICGSFPGPFAADVEDRVMTALEEL